MEALLKFWTNGAGVAGCGATELATQPMKIKQVLLNTQGKDNDDNDEGPFFDLKFTVPEDLDNDDSDGKQEHDQETDFYEDERSRNSESSEGTTTTTTTTTDVSERELNFTVCSSGSFSSRRTTDPNLTLSPSDDLFFKGSCFQFDSSSGFNSPEPNSTKSVQFPISLLKSATKFRVFLLGFKKPKSGFSDKAESINGGESPLTTTTTTTQKKPKTQTTKQNNLFTVKLKVEEVPIFSLLTRERTKNNKIDPEQKKISKDAVQKYVKMIKQGSKRYGEKMRFSSSTSGSNSPTVIASPSKIFHRETTEEAFKSQKSGFRDVCKHLGKSRSASSVVAASPSEPRRSDDSLVQQEDGIRSAILHCKRSFNGSSSSTTRGKKISESEYEFNGSDSSQLSRSVSDPTHEKSIQI